MEDIVVEQRKKKPVAQIAIAVIVLIIIAIIIFLLTRGDDDTMNEGNYKEIVEQTRQEVEEGYFETYMTTNWTFKDGKSKSEDAVLGNSPNNSKPIRCEVTLDSTGETVLTTDVLPVGAEMPPFKLDVDLDPGEYDATCMVYLLDKKKNGKYTEYSNAGFHVTITVES